MVVYFVEIISLKFNDSFKDKLCLKVKASFHRLIQECGVGTVYTILLCHNIFTGS